MFGRVRYLIVLMPQAQVAAQLSSLGEARAWAGAYNEVMRDSRVEAVVADARNPMQNETCDAAAIDRP